MSPNSYFLPCSMYSSSIPSSLVKFNVMLLLKAPSNLNFTLEMTPRTPKDTLAALRRGSLLSNLWTLANPSSADPGTTRLSPTTWSWRAPPLPHHELPWAPVLIRPPTVTPSQ
uniref:Uncharacterized protein n=1 Tax=Opuntia streptacantha TaxID=393608 RepID=A0A7C9E5Q8_OPUST